MRPRLHERVRRVLLLMRVRQVKLISNQVVNNMPRRTKKKKAGADAPTYYKAKNGRFYKKIQVEGKTRVRFVSNAEATGAMKLSDSKPSRKRKPRVKKAEVKPAESSEEKQQEVTSE